MFESPDDRTAYHAARSLVDVRGQPHPFLLLKGRLLAAPGVVVSSVPRSIAFACQEKLAALGLATQITHQTARPPETTESSPPPKTSSGLSLFQFIRDRPGTAFAVLVGIGLVAAVFLLGRDESSSVLDAPVGPISAEQFAALAEAAIVDLTCEKRSGVGFFVAEGIAVTAANVACPAVPAVNLRFSNGRTDQGRVIRVDNWLDLALVRTTAVSGLPLFLADSARIQKGDSLFVAKRSGGGATTTVRVRVTDANRSLLGISYLQIDTGNTTCDSGEPLFDDTGRVVGVIVSRVGSSASLWLAVPSNYLVDGRNAVLPDLDFKFDRVGWEARLSDAAAADHRAVAKAQTSPSQVGVIAATSGSPASVVVTVARWSKSAPSDQSVSFTIRRGDTIMCSLSGNTNGWQRAGSGSVAIPDSRYVTWLERNELLRESFVSTVSLDTSGCNDRSAVAGATLVMHSGAPYADRATIAAY